MYIYLNVCYGARNCEPCLTHPQHVLVEMDTHTHTSCGGGDTLEISGIANLLNFCGGGSPFTTTADQNPLSPELFFGVSLFPL